MVEKSMEHSRTGAAYAALADRPEPAVVYGITAVRMEDGHVSWVMMGMIAPDFGHWDLRPAPTRLVEVVDRLVEGDTVVTLFTTERGTLQLGSQVTVDLLPEGIETLASSEDRPGRRLSDLPRF
jgi:hypothetical protein